MRFRAHSKAAFGDVINDIVVAEGECTIDGNDIKLAFASDDEISYISIYDGDIADEVCLGRVDVDSSGDFEITLNRYRDVDLGETLKIVG